MQNALEKELVKKKTTDQSQDQINEKCFIMQGIKNA
jgi:hypothetical protein